MEILSICVCWTRSHRYNDKPKQPDLPHGFQGGGKRGERTDDPFSAVAKLDHSSTFSSLFLFSLSFDRVQRQEGRRQIKRGMGCSRCLYFFCSHCYAGEFRNQGQLKAQRTGERIRQLKKGPVIFSCTIKAGSKKEHDQEGKNKAGSRIEKGREGREQRMDKIEKREARIAIENNEYDDNDNED